MSALRGEVPFSDFQDLTAIHDGPQLEVVEPQGIEAAMAALETPGVGAGGWIRRMAEKHRVERRLTMDRLVKSTRRAFSGAEIVADDTGDGAENDSYSFDEVPDMHIVPSEVDLTSRQRARLASLQRTPFARGIGTRITPEQREAADAKLRPSKEEA